MILVFNQFEVDAVIVDLDGTMVDTLGDFCVALNHMLGDLPPPFNRHQVDRATVARLVGKGSAHLIKCVLSQVSQRAEATSSGAGGLSVDALEHWYRQAWPRYQQHYLAVNGQHAVVYPGVAAGLAQLQAQGLKLACLTNKPTAWARSLLQAKGLDRFFEVTFGGDAFARAKPDPLPLLSTCAVLGCTPPHTLMIGDSSNDALAARAAGCPVLLVTYGYNHGEPVQQVDADSYVDSLQSPFPVG